ncbi:UNVERIFIED_CONTAM: hypothetical protein RMT77_007718 [Armadillidium vulgare]
MDKYLTGKRIANRESRRSTTPEIECDAAGTSHEKSSQDDIEQRFPTWGTRTPGGTPAIDWGYAKKYRLN